MTKWVVSLKQEGKEDVYGWISLKRVPRLLRPHLIPTFLDHFPEPLRPFDIYASLAPALSGARTLAAELGIKLPADIALPHPSGLILFNVPFPSLAGILVHLPSAFLRLRQWTRYDPLREWRRDGPYLHSLLSGSGAKEPDVMPEGELVAEIERVGMVIRRNMWLRFRKYLPPLLPAQRRQRALLRRAVGDRADEYANRLLQGLDYKTSMINRALKALARTATEETRVLEILSGTEPGSVLSALKADPACAAFVAQFERFLDENGARGATSMEPQPSYFSWREQPETVLHLVVALAGAATGSADDDEAMKRELYLSCRRDVAERLGDPELVSQFERVTEIVRGASLARDDTFYFFEECVDRIRRCANRLGETLASKEKLEEPRDIYHLSPGELRTLVDSPSGSSEARDLGELAENRSRAWMQMRAKWDQRGTTVDSLAVDLRGVGASAGRTVGTARVIGGPGEFGKLKPGDVLVCPSTSPAWTPLFIIASAVVTDIGGIASHAAIVAREYGIPAVMGCGNATRVLADGDRIEVDGTHGAVRRVR